MSVAPLPLDRTAHGSRVGARRLVGAPPVRRPPSRRGIARRRWMVGLTKRLLPVVALVLLSAIALWPEISSDFDRARLAYRKGPTIDPENGQLIDPRYHGVDERNRPYTMTAATAMQKGPERVDLTEPKGDVLLENGRWLMVQSRSGVYMQHAGQLDLSKDVTLYRDDGTTMQTEAAAIDLKAGAAASAERTHAEGPFGVLDAQGFALTDKGTIVQFTGPGRLVMNAASK